MGKGQLGFELCRSTGMLILPYLKLADVYLPFGLGFGLGFFCCCYGFWGFLCLGMWGKEVLRVQKLMSHKVQN